MPPPIAIADLIAGLARDAINIQLRLDQHHEAEFREYAALIEQAPEAARPFLAAIAPTCQVATEFSVETGVLLDVSRTTGFAIGCRPLNAEFSVRTNTRSERHSRFQIEVTRGPIQP